MNEQEKSRRKKIATVVVVLPLVVGMIIVSLGHFLGHEESNVAKEKEAPEVAAKIQRQTAAAPAAAGTPAPRVRLTNGATGESFDSSSIGSDPYAVVFINTKCEAIGTYLGRVASELKAKGDAVAVLAISADPAVDTPEAVSAWVAKHKLKGGPVHYLVGDEDELSGLWNAWGFDGRPRRARPASRRTSSTAPAKTTGSSTSTPRGRPPCSPTPSSAWPNRRSAWRNLCRRSQGPVVPSAAGFYKAIRGSWDMAHTLKGAVSAAASPTRSKIRKRWVTAIALVARGGRARTWPASSSPKRTSPSPTAMT